MSSVISAIGGLFAGPPTPPPAPAAMAAPPTAPQTAVPLQAQQQAQMEAGAYGGTLKTKGTDTGELGAPKPATTAGAENLGAGPGP